MKTVYVYVDDHVDVDVDVDVDGLFRPDPRTPAQTSAPSLVLVLEEQERLVELM